MSITLTTGTLVQVNGATVENDTTGGDTAMNVDYLANVASFTLRTGVLAGGNLNAGNYGPKVTINVDLTTGQYTSYDATSGATFSGIVPAAALANFVTQVKANRNLIEVFASGTSGIMPGTQVPW